MIVRGLRTAYNKWKTIFAIQNPILNIFLRCGINLSYSTRQWKKNYPRDTCISFILTKDAHEENAAYTGGSNHWFSLSHYSRM